MNKTNQNKFDEVQFEKELIIQVLVETLISKMGILKAREKLKNYYQTMLEIYHLANKLLEERAKEIKN